MKDRGIMLKMDYRHEQGMDIFGLLQRISGTSPVDVMNVRLMVEPQAASAAASNATDSDLKGISDAHDAAKQCQEPATFELLDAEFHKRIFAATRNELLTCVNDILGVIRSQTPWIEIKRRSYSEARRLAYCSDHDAILKALYARDMAGAALAMRKHLLAVNDNLFGMGGATQHRP
jgi:DNA-binding FadR family transcriptional regulator